MTVRYPDRVSSTSTNVDKGPFVGSSLRIIWQWVQARIDATVHAAGFEDINRAHINLFRYPGAQGRRPTEIAEALQITKQSVNDLVAHLEERGYLNRVVDADDSRARIVRLTVKGKKLERAVFDAARRADRALAEMLGARRFLRLRHDLDELAQLTSEGSA